MQKKLKPREHSHEKEKEDEANGAKLMFESDMKILLRKKSEKAEKMCFCITKRI